MKAEHRNKVDGFYKFTEDINKNWNMKCRATEVAPQLKTLTGFEENEFSSRDPCLLLDSPGAHTLVP